MPNRDGTGPDGKGAGTGRGLGPCKTKKKKVNRGLRPRNGTGRKLGNRRGD